jgi:hypothetical protein
VPFRPQTLSCKVDNGPSAVDGQTGYAEKGDRMNRLTFLTATLAVSAFGFVGCDDSKTDSAPATPPSTKTENLDKEAKAAGDEAKAHSDAAKDATDKAAEKGKEAAESLSEDQKKAAEAQKDATENRIEGAKDQADKGADALKDAAKEAGK